MNRCGLLQDMQSISEPYVEIKRHAVVLNVLQCGFPYWYWMSTKSSIKRLTESNTLDKQASLPAITGFFVKHH